MRVLFYKLDFFILFFLIKLYFIEHFYMNNQFILLHCARLVKDYFVKELLILYIEQKNQILIVLIL